MTTIYKDDFFRNPEEVLAEAAVKENYARIPIEGGHVAVILDEIEYTMLRQAMNICLDHPEWMEDFR